MCETDRKAIIDLLSLDILICKIAFNPIKYCDPSILHYHLQTPNLISVAEYFKVNRN
jgi:hypothetical protein